MSYKKFFNEYGDLDMTLIKPGGWEADKLIDIEELYQSFKSRLVNELQGKLYKGNGEFRHVKISSKKSGTS